MSQLLQYKARLMVFSFGIIYFWFGLLKFFPGVSPAEDLAKATLDRLTLGLIPSHISFLMLASWEVTIGILMLLNFTHKWVIRITMLHLLFTFTPLILLPDASFNGQAYSLSLVGQYIIKNLILLFALLYIIPDTRQVAVEK